MVSARALHYVLKIGDRGANINFFRNILGMKVGIILCLLSKLWVFETENDILFFFE